MPILATYNRGDARGTAHLLAAMALECLIDPDAAPEQEVALNNVYRLLEAFRTGSLGRVERLNRLPESRLDRLTMRRHVQHRIKDVREALAAALDAAFPGKSAATSIKVIEDVLRFLVSPQEVAKPSKENLRSTTTFFESLVKHLAAD